jgi:histidinol dehydrogenase
MRVIRGRIERNPAPSARATEVTEIIEAVRTGGDAAVARLSERFDGVAVEPAALRVSADALRDARDQVPPDVLEATGVAIDNVRAVAEAQLRDPADVALPAGQTISVAEVPVRRAAVYVPGGRAPYPSTVVMGAVTARAAGVDEIAVCSPPGPGGPPHPVVLAACALCELDEVWAIGGVQAVAALAYGTESLPAVDVIVGPGNAWVTEAKRQVYGQVGIDGLAGPSELVVLAGEGADPEPIALDLLAQAEHGDDSLLWLISADDGLRGAVAALVEKLASERPSVTDAELMLVEAADADDALRIAEEIAPEHLQLVGREAEALAGEVRRAGCVFVGPGAATAFGDYVAGSNHILPTGGAARFQSAVSPATFRRRMARVSFPHDAAARLAAKGAPLARAEGFPVHAESMERRA